MFVIIHIIRNLINTTPSKWVFQSQKKIYSPFEVALGVHILSFVLGNAL